MCSARILTEISLNAKSLKKRKKPAKNKHLFAFGDFGDWLYVMKGLHWLVWLVLILVRCLRWKLKVFCFFLIMHLALSMFMAFYFPLHIWIFLNILISQSNSHQAFEGQFYVALVIFCPSLLYQLVLLCPQCVEKLCPALFLEKWASCVSPSS